MPQPRAGRGPLILIALAAVAALAGIAGWAWLPRAKVASQEPVKAKPEAVDPPPPMITSSDPDPERGLWCSFAGDVPLCGQGLSACERKRGASRAPTAPCDRITPACFILEDPRDGKIRVCTPTMNGCEQIRTGTMGKDAVTGCLPSNGDVVPDARNLLVGVELPRDVYCSGEAPLEPDSCAPTARACEAQRRDRDRRGRGDFGPCRLIP